MGGGFGSCLDAATGIQWMRRVHVGTGVDPRRPDRAGDGEADDQRRDAPATGFLAIVFRLSFHVGSRLVVRRGIARRGHNIRVPRAGTKRCPPIQKPTWRTPMRQIVLNPVRILRALAPLALILAFAVPRAAGAQMLGVPVLQNGFTNPGITVAINYGSADSVRGYGLAAAWAPPSGSFQVSGGIGGYDRDEGKTWASYGGRVA